MILVDGDLALGALLGLLELLELRHVVPGGGGNASLFAKLRLGPLSGLLVAGDPVDFLVAG